MAGASRLGSATIVPPQKVVIPLIPLTGYYVAVEGIYHYMTVQMVEAPPSSLYHRHQRTSQR